jgi:hypothetical protein
MGRLFKLLSNIGRGYEPRSDTGILLLHLRPMSEYSYEPRAPVYRYIRSCRPLLLTPISRRKHLEAIGLRFPASWRLLASASLRPFGGYWPPLPCVLKRAAVNLLHQKLVTIFSSSCEPRVDHPRSNRLELVMPRSLSKSQNLCSPCVR